MRSFQATVELFRAHIQQQRWSIIEEKPIQSAVQLVVTDEQNRTPVVCYTTGTVLIQGAASPLKTHLQTWWNLQQPPKETTASPFKAHIGADEAGKGDYFGPLVVAGIFVDEQRASQLRALAVRDSKTISDTAIFPLAEEIKRLCSPQHFHILAYQPAEYNRLYQEVQNLNRLLAKAHAQTIQVVQQKTGCQYALVDQFGPEVLVEQALQVLGCQMTLEQRMHAEEDVAVAAASILARATFLQHLERLSRDVQMMLPKGGSNPDIVAIGKVLVAQAGRDRLGSVAKVHFQTTQHILQ